MARVQPVEGNTRAKCTQVIIASRGRDRDVMNVVERGYYHLPFILSLEPTSIEGTEQCERERADQLPPAGVAKPPRVHPSHVAHADDTYDEALHSWRSLDSCGSGGHVSLLCCVYLQKNTKKGLEGQ